MILFSDEAGVKLDADLCKMWAPKGEQPLIVSHSPYGRLNLTGFVCPQRGYLMINCMEKGNAVNFINQLEQVRDHYKEFELKIYVDNAKWHKTKAVYDWIAKNPQIKLDFLPTYAPDANPMERHWWYLRKKKLKNIVFENKSQCWAAIKEHIKDLSSDTIKTICKI